MISGWTKASQARTASGGPGRIVLTGHGKDLLDDQKVQRTYLGWSMIIPRPSGREVYVARHIEQGVESVALGGSAS